ncbi:hypothetical protein F4777DRAFT_581671 [Nemania sp. FL0916]|nr:hypothetical protein F4777DRAFT_581671 [Nemania sp. FL0916]
MATVQVHVLEDNMWVVRNMAPEELIVPSRPQSISLAPVLSAPEYGILTRTIVQSPVIRWVLPVQLRSSSFNDLILVGDQFLQIFELRADTQLYPISGRIEFSSRVRSCLVMGTHDYLRRSREDVHANYHGTDDIDMASCNPSTPTFDHEDAEPYQVLVLVLAQELMFLCMNAATDHVFAIKHPISNVRHLVEPGFQTAISPKGGYLALACSEHIFVVYELESIVEIRKKCNERQPFQAVRSHYAVSVKGVIHSLEFLHPGPEHPSHVVLLLITVQSGVIKLAIYEWEEGESLRSVLSMEKPGHRLDSTLGLPLLVIPLTFSCQFLIVTERSMAVCSGLLSGPPVFTPFRLTSKGGTDRHHGTHDPMWTAWTRPFREGSYHAGTDFIYLAREDGWVNCLEIKSDLGIECGIYMGPLNCSIDTGFASISTSQGELLVACGTDGHGAIWKIHPRQRPQPVASLPNWSPTLDLVSTKNSINHYTSEHRKLSKRLLPADMTPSNVSAPDRIFACSGRDMSGAIIELRYGIEAKIGLDLSYSSFIKKCWAIPSFSDTSERGFYLLLALPGTSAILHIPYDLSETPCEAEDTFGLDLLSTTLAFYVSKDVVIQITATHAVILSPAGSYVHAISNMIEDLKDPLATITDAVITGEALALSVFSQSAFKIVIFTFGGNTFEFKDIFDIEGEVTALSIATLSIGTCILAGVSVNSAPSIAVYPISSSQSKGQEQLTPDHRRVAITPKPGEDDDMAINAVTSIITHSSEKILVGMRNGDVHTVRIKQDSSPEEQLVITRSNHFGVSPSHVFPGTIANGVRSTLVCNDTGLAIMNERDRKSNYEDYEEIFRVWLTDANEPHAPSPTVNSIASLREIPGYGASTWAMVAGSRILLTEVRPMQPGPVPRYIRTGGTPLQILYSQRLEALVTVVVKSGVPSLHFLDPVTGADLSHPVRQNDGVDMDVDYITNLGYSNIKITSLLHWWYKDKHEWFVILARFKEDQGRLLIVLADEERAVPKRGLPRRIRFWTQFYRKIKNGSARCGTTDSNGLFLNFDKTLEYHVIEDKKFTTAMTYDLPSPATSLEVVGGYLHVLTAHHSLIILDYTSADAIKSHRMVQKFTDQLARNSVHSVNLGPFLGMKESQKLVLMSNLMCGVYGLWSPGLNFNTASLRSIFKANLSASILKFVHGRTRPRWTRVRPRYQNLPSRLDMPDILGLAIDGSVVQFSLLEQHVWKLLDYIQQLARATGGSKLVPVGRSSNPCANDAGVLAVPNAGNNVGKHIDGDILLRCLQRRALEQLVSTPDQMAQLQQLLAVLDSSNSDSGTEDDPIPIETGLAFEYAYSIIEHHVAPAL